MGIKISELAHPRHGLFFQEAEDGDEESSEYSSDSDQDEDLVVEPWSDAQNNNDHAELDRIISEINQAIASGEPVDLEQYPTLYVVHYRGTHFFREFYDQDARQETRAEIYENNFMRPIYSPAVYDLAGVEFGEQLPENVNALVARINNAFTEMENGRPLRAFWAGNRRHHSNYLYQHYQRFVNTYAQFMQESEELGQRYNCYTFLPSRKTPYVATADAAWHAVLYALGAKADHGHGLMRPSYVLPEGRAKHPKPGYVQIILHTLPELIAQRPLMLSSLHAFNAIDINDRLLSERETSFRAYIPAENVAATHVVRFPSFNIGFNGDYHPDKYGIEPSRSYSKFANNIRRFDVTVNPGAGTTILDRIATNYAAELERQANQIVRNRNGLLVYLGLDGRLTRTLPTTLEISNQRANSVRDDIQNTPIYDNLELLLPREGPQPR